MAVRVTTGRLKGGAALDAQQVALRAAQTGRPRFEMWERPQLVAWFSASPESARGGDAPALLTLIASIDQKSVSEPDIERFSRDWLALGEEESRRAARTAIEGAILCNRLRNAHRLDLAALTALHVFRAAWPSDYGDTRPALAVRAVGLFCDYVDLLAAQIEPYLSHPNALLGEFLEPVAIFSYPAALVRLNELFALRWLLSDGGDSGADRCGAIVETICEVHQACIRPVSDQFAAAIAPVALALARLRGKEAARNYLARCAKWTLDRYDASESGLGLAALEESEEVACERILGGTLSSTSLDRRSGSYVSTVLLDLCTALGLTDLYESLRHNFNAVQVVPSSTRADESTTRWARGGLGVNPHPRLDYARGDEQPRAAHHEWTLAGPSAPVDRLLLAASCRSRHSFTALQQLAPGDPQA